MILEKITVVDQIEVLESGVVQVRTAIRVVEDNQIISSSLHRHIIAPGDEYLTEDARVKAICKATHTLSVIAEYKAAQSQSVAPS